MYTNHYNRRQTPQTEQAHAKQVSNSAGGYSFQVDKWERLKRFLVLGAEGGSYYASERKLTRENAKCVDECFAEDPTRTVALISSISSEGRAPKNTPAIFALALGVSHDNKAAKLASRDAVPVVCRTGTHLLQFVEMAQAMRGWGPLLRSAVGSWYDSKSPTELAYQVAKYRQRGGWSHRDVLRKAHWTPAEDKEPVVRWVIGAGTDGRSVKRGDAVSEYAATQPLPDYLAAFDELQAAENKRDVIRLIEAHRFTHEMVPSQWLGERDVWAALLERMPMGAMVRNLARMTANGLIAPMSNAANDVSQRLVDEGIVRRSKLHPIALLSALKTYESGKGAKGSLTWAPVPAVVDALDSAFYASFGNVESTGKRTLLALDVSGSMSWSAIAGCPGVTPAVGSAAMAMVTARAEQQWHCMAFSDWLHEARISPRQRLNDVIQTLRGIPMGRTDCALPMLWALQQKVPVDTFVVYTDSETWFGKVHPHQALEWYRQAMGIGAKLVVVGMLSNGFTIANPGDPGMLDVVGFDTTAPNLIASFSKGW